jgi:hypothetical protein
MSSSPRRVSAGSHLLRYAKPIVRTLLALVIAIAVVGAAGTAIASADAGSAKPSSPPIWRCC